MPTTDFTPWSALAGGALIGLAATLLWWLDGRIAGISGIARHVDASPDGRWRWAFLIGLVAGAGLWAVLAGPMPRRTGMGGGLLLSAGLLVGYGAALGQGCTSGHGVCGIARRSPRSFAATAVFLGTALLTTWIVRHAVPAA